MTNDDEVNADAYRSLRMTISEIRPADKSILLGARVRRGCSNWSGVIGKHGVGNANSNGTLLLSLCTESEECITNTLFEGRNQHKTTWQHGCVVVTDNLFVYVITRQQDRADDCDTKALPS